MIGKEYGGSAVGAGNTALQPGCINYSNPSTGVASWIGEAGKPLSASMGNEVEKLSGLYMRAFHLLFDLHQTATMGDYLEALRAQGVQPLFIDWFQSKGAPGMNRLWTSEYAGTRSQLAKIQFVTNAIEQDLQWTDRSLQSTRSVLVNTLSGLSKELEMMERWG